VRVFVDECVHLRLCRDMVGHEVKTGRQMDWSTIENGELLALATKGFDVFVTVDRNLSFQPNLTLMATSAMSVRFIDYLGTKTKCQRRLAWLT